MRILIRCTLSRGSICYDLAPAMFSWVRSARLLLIAFFLSLPILLLLLLFVIIAIFLVCGLLGLATFFARLISYNGLALRP